VFVEVFLGLLLFAAICNRPAPADGPLTSLEAASRKAAFAWSGVEPEWSEKYAAATPDAIAVASLVPDPRNRPLACQPCGLSCAISESGATRPSTCTPLATTSGFCTPATTPLPEKGATDGLEVLRSAAPIVVAYGSMPGSPTSPATLPDAATTRTPAARTCSTATVNGSAPYDGAVGR